MIEDKYRDKLNSDIITLDRDTRALQKLINDNKDKIVDLRKQMQDLDKYNDIHEIMLWNENINQLKQQNDYNTLAMKLKQKEQQRLKNELNLYDRLQRQEQQRLENVPSIKFVKEGEEKKIKKEITKMNKDWDRYNHNRNKVYSKNREPFSKQIDATRAFVKNADKDLNLPNIRDRKFNLIREKNNIQNKQRIKELENDLKACMKEKDVAKKISKLERVNNAAKEVLNKKHNSKNCVYDTRPEIYRWRFGVNGNPLKIKNHKQPEWKVYAKEGLPPLGKIQNINGLNKNNLKKE